MHHAVIIFCTQLMEILTGNTTAEEPAGSVVNRLLFLQYLLSQTVIQVDLPLLHHHHHLRFCPPPHLHHLHLLPPPLHLQLPLIYQ